MQKKGLTPSKDSVGAYRIIYQVFREPDTVFVLRFWHGARGTPDIAKAPRAE